MSKGKFCLASGTPTDAVPNSVSRKIATLRRLYKGYHLTEFISQRLPLCEEPDFFAPVLKFLKAMVLVALPRRFF